MKTYFTADLHLGHEKVAYHRGFNTVEEHDAAVLRGLKEVAHSGNQIFILGDISGGKTEDQALIALYLIKARGANFHLVCGNHDSYHPMHRHYVKNRRGAHGVFTTIDSMGTFRHNRDKIMLSHFPYTGDRGEERYPEYRLNDAGKPIIHGHTHSTEKVSYSGKGTLQICVSQDAWGFKPAPKDELVKLINKRLGEAHE